HPALQAAAARCPRRHLAHGAGGCGASAGVPQVYRVLSLSGRLPRAARAPHVRRVRRTAPSRLRRRARDEPDRRRQPHPRFEERPRDRLLQHHQVLHHGVSGRDHHYRQRDYSVERARHRSAVRPGRKVVPSSAIPVIRVRREVPMQFTLKPLSQEAVPRALAKAEHYRLLNEPGEAESICRDALEVEPDNQEALATLLLALTEQFVDGASTTVADAWKTVGRLRDEYERTYYTGILQERRAKAQL